MRCGGRRPPLRNVAIARRQLTGAGTSPVRWRGRFWTSGTTGAVDNQEGTAMTHSPNKARWSTIGAVLICLSGCGGGGDSDPPPAEANVPPPAPPPPPPPPPP